MPRYAELVMETYLTLTIPDIWSPVYINKLYDENNQPLGDKYAPYEFRWIEDLGTHIIKEIENIWTPIKHAAAMA